MANEQDDLIARLNRLIADRIESQDARIEALQDENERILRIAVDRAVIIDSVREWARGIDTENKLLKAKNDQLAAELAQANRDAERHRWLRGDSCPDHSIRWTQWDVRCWVGPFWSDDLRREGLDKSIDAAMAAEQAHGIRSEK